MRHLAVVFLVWLVGGFPTLVFALPEDGQIVSGSGSITEPTSTSMQVDQYTGQMIVNWNSFSIGGSESVNFSQPGTDSIALNRVIGADPSLLLGNLTANGQVFITNGSGVFFGPGSKVDTHGLIATTMGISDQDFLNQNYNFSQDLDDPLTSVINEGTISATSYVGLLAPAVANKGTIVASLGSVDLAAGKAATLDFTGDGLINFEVTEAVSGIVTDKDGNVLQDRVSNSGLIQADGGQVRMSAKDAGDVIRHVVNMEGTIQANTVVEKEGRVFLTGGSSGVVNVSGTITASGNDSGEQGGTVHVLGEKVGLFDNAVVNVSGDAGGGTALIGGDFQGKNAEVQNAFRTYVGEDAVIDASAGTSGDGGKVIVWADDVTRFYGSVLATGGSLSGDGGFVEVSGKGSLNFHAHQIALGSANGVDGILLLDPLNITITTSADSNTAGFTAGSDDTEVFAEDSGLTSNFDVTASTGSFNGVTGTIELQATNDITVSAAWNIATSTGNSNVNVVLRAGNDININQAITLDGTGTLTIEADGNTADGAGDLVFGSSGSLTTANQAINITANDIDITSPSGVSLTAGTGTVTILVSDGGTIGLGDTAGDMTITGAELQKMAGGNLVLGDATNGNITVNNITGDNSNNFSSTVTLNATGASANVIFQTAAAVFNQLVVNAGAAITINSALTTDVANLTLSAGGDITQSAALSVAGTSDFTVTGTNAMTLTQANTFTGAITLASGTGAVQLTDSSATILAASTLGGDLTFTSGGNITQTGIISVTGSASFTSSAGSITLSNASNDLGANLTLDANNSFNIVTTSTLTDLTVTVDPGSGANTYSLTDSGSQTFSMTTDGTDLTITDVSNTGAVNQTITATTGNVTVTNFDSTSGNVTLTASTGNIVLGNDAINAGTGKVALTSTLGSITESASNTTANITNTGTLNLTAGTSIGTTGTNNELDVASATNLTFDVNDSFFVRGGAQTIDGLTLTVDPSGAATYTLANFNAAQTFSMTTDGTDLTVTDVSNTGAVNQTITAKTGDINVTNMDSTGTVISLIASAGNIVVGSGGLDFSRNNIVSLDASGTITGAGLTTVTITQGDKRFKTGTASIGTLSLSGGTLTVDGAVSVTSAATWSGGTISGTGTLTTDSAVTTTMSASAAATLDTNVTWENNGTIDWNFSISDFTIDGTLNNNSGANFNLQNTNFNSDILGSGTVNNAGTMTENSTTSETDFEPTFNNTGAVVVTNGDLQLNGTGTDTGTYTVASGEILSFFNASGTRDLQSGSSVSGAGTVKLGGFGTRTVGGTYNVTGTTELGTGTNTLSATGITSLGDLTVIGSGGVNTITGANITSIGDITISNGTTTLSTGNAFSVANLTVTAGTLQGDDDITVTSAAAWSGGTISGTRTLTTNSAVTTTMAASAAATLDTNVTWENNGTIDWNFSISDFTIDGTLNNNSGANFNLQNTNFNSDILGSGTLNNLGTLTVNSSTTQSTIAAVFNNDGAAVVTSGNLDLTGSGTDTGTYTVATGEDLVFGNTSGTRDLQSGSSVSGAGNVTFSGAGTRTIAGTYSVTGTTSLSAGTNTFSSSGTIGMDTLTVSGGTNTFSSSSLSATGTFTLSGAGTISTSGTDLSISAVDFDLTSTAISAGAGKVTITQSAGGTIGLGATAGAMTISDTELDLISATDVLIGDGTVGAITVNGVSNTAITGTLALISSSTVDFSTASSTITNGGLTVIAGGNITQGVALTVGGELQLHHHRG